MPVATKRRNNPVAKHSNRLNRPQTHRDRTKYYRQDEQIMFYQEDDESFEEVRVKWAKICREFSDAALRETAKENISFSSPVYIACQDEMNRRNKLAMEKSMRDEVRPYLNKRKRQIRRNRSLKNKELHA